MLKLGSHVEVKEPHSQAKKQNHMEEKGAERRISSLYSASSEVERGGKGPTARYLSEKNPAKEGGIGRGPGKEHSIPKFGPPRRGGEKISSQ